MAAHRRIKASAASKSSSGESGVSVAVSAAAYHRRDKKWRARAAKNIKIKEINR